MYKVSRLIGGGASHWYLLAPCGRIVDSCHERHELELLWLHRVADFLNLSRAYLYQDEHEQAKVSERFATA